MKKRGILNAELICELTKLRHLDSLVICDIGFPIPKGAKVVDVSLVAGIPSFAQTLKAILNEMIFEEYVIFDFMKDYNQENYNLVKTLLIKQKAREVPMDDFIEIVNDVKLFIRTGETRPASNILLVSASGVPEISDEFDVICEDKNS